jgi:hypothetical protein
VIFQVLNFFGSNSILEEETATTYILHFVSFLVGGWFVSLAVVGYTALAVRKLVKTAYTSRAHEQTISVYDI